ncbi:hypothetical protein LTR93_012331 [Exophiala xenobiotica]|nr:hypothetical protein LTR93_012331 [Exophiala xenobiotica]
MPTVDDVAPLSESSNDVDDMIAAIPKTVVFFRSYTQIMNAWAQLIKVLISRLRSNETVAQDIVQGYYSGRSDRSKEETHQRFSDPGSNLRILLATDALVRSS